MYDPEPHQDASQPIQGGYPMPMEANQVHDASEPQGYPMIDEADH